MFLHMMRNMSCSHTTKFYRVYDTEDFLERSKTGYYLFKLIHNQENCMIMYVTIR